MCKAEHGIGRDDRQHLHKEMRELFYAKTEESFDEKMEALGKCEQCGKYPQYLSYLQETYGGRHEAWGLYSRIERKLPTHGSNTNAYAEVSMKMTKEIQFGRTKTRNLPELLHTICDNSAIYVNKLIEVGNNRANLKRAKSKYIGPKNKLTIEQTVDCGEGNYLVQSEQSEEVWYSLNMKTGFCTCPVGVNCAPCKHKSSVSTLYNIAEFSVAPDTDPYQRALYHYIAMGSTLPAHMYR